MILITGAGTLGTALAKRFIDEDCPIFQGDDVRVVDYSEDALWRLEESVGERKDMELVLADINDRERMRLAMKDVHTIYHTAALKHVRYTNDNPIECIRTNIEGVATFLLWRWRRRSRSS
jgi:UDP-N-acetylglucosamine 4,6-dehydratase